MEKFMPPEEIMNKILDKKDKLMYTYHMIPKNLNKFNLEMIMGATVASLAWFVSGCYSLGFQPQDNFNTQQFSEVFFESYRNEIAHGPKEKEFFEYGLFLGDKGLCHGIVGDYFKSEKVKSLWENKLPVDSTKSGFFCGGGFGDEMIHAASDLIRVDDKKGIMYCMQTHKSLGIKPSDFYFKY